MKEQQGKKKEEKNYACAGIAIFHSHAPFAAVYDIAEECCENAKKKSRKTGGNYFDWYFCRSGLTNDMETTIYNLVTFTPSGTNVPPPSGREALSAPSLRGLSA